jgi:hypothetical protein
MGSVRVKTIFCLHLLVNTGGFNEYHPLSTFGHEIYRRSERDEYSLTIMLSFDELHARTLERLFAQQ